VPLSNRSASRREFLVRGAAAAAAGIGLVHLGCGADNEPQPSVSTSRAPGQVAIVRQRDYALPGLQATMTQAFDLLGGIGELVRGRTVTIKVNLTGYAQALLGRPPGETYATHDATAIALARVLADLGARRIRFVESCQWRGDFEEYARTFGWDVAALGSAGPVEFENTRNLGQGRAYARLTVPDGGRLFSYFEVNHSYADTDVLISLAKMKHHVTAGVTLTTKNLFGITPNSLYGTEAPSEEAIAYRGSVHTRSEGNVPVLPGERAGFDDRDATYRIPRVVTDVLAARPVDLAILDGITSIAGGEGPWISGIRPVAPGVLVAGLNAVSTDAVCVALMGYPDPLATRGTPPFSSMDNHLRLSHDAGLGVGDLARIDVRGVSIEEGRYDFEA